MFTASTADISQGLVGRSTLDGKITMYPLPTPNALVWGIARGPNNDLYFTEITGAIGRITLVSGVQITEYRVPTSGSNPLGIAMGADKNMWFVVLGYSFIGRFHTHWRYSPGLS
jgi:virginiamycin B lyase